MNDFKLIESMAEFDAYIAESIINKILNTLEVESKGSFLEKLELIETYAWNFKSDFLSKRVNYYREFDSEMNLIYMDKLIKADKKNTLCKDLFERLIYYKKTLEKIGVLGSSAIKKISSLEFAMECYMECKKQTPEMGQKTIPKFRVLLEDNEKDFVFVEYWSEEEGFGFGLKYDIITISK